MYESFFELSDRPFVCAPRTDRYFPGAAIEEARKRLTRCIERAEGPALLIGAAGTGKSLLCQVLAERFQSELAIAQLANVRLCSRRALLQAILFELGMPYREMEEGELRLSLIDRLSAGADGRAGMLLLVDEAHNLPLSLLEEIRMITNLVRDGEPRVRLVLAGLLALEERFASPKLDSLNQRLAARCYLESLDRNETMQYIRAQITASGGAPDALFAPAALEAVHGATDGVPRLINQLCDHALLLASAGGVRQLTAEGIDEAWSDLQQLPTPWCTAAGGSASTGNDNNVIEFGCLGGDQDPPDADDADAGLPETTVPMVLEDDGPPAAATNQPAPFEIVGHPSVESDGELDGDHSDEFEPAGSIGPELELVFDGQPSPFAESFDDEEVVIDQYAALEQSVFDQRPQVAARVDTMTQYLLRQAAAPPERPNLSLAGAAVETGTPEPGAVAPAAVDTLPEDCDLIIVEDDREEHDEPAVTPVRPQEYRQLFAKLRRG